MRCNDAMLIEGMDEDTARARLLRIWGMCGRDQYHRRDEVDRLRRRLEALRVEAQYRAYQATAGPIDSRD